MPRYGWFHSSHGICIQSFTINGQALAYMEITCTFQVMFLKMENVYDFHITPNMETCFFQKKKNVWSCFLFGQSEKNQDGSLVF